MEASIARQVGRLEVLYDKEVDVLYLSIGTPRPADTFEEKEGLLIDRDPETREVVGLTVLDYERKFRRLPDLSWVRQLHLPTDLTSYLLDRPSLGA